MSWHCRWSPERSIKRQIVASHSNRNMSAILDQIRCLTSDLSEALLMSQAEMTKRTGHLLSHDLARDYGFRFEVECFLFRNALSSIPCQRNNRAIWPSAVKEMEASQHFDVSPSKPMARSPFVDRPCDNNWLRPVTASPSQPDRSIGSLLPPSSHHNESSRSNSESYHAASNPFYSHRRPTGNKLATTGQSRSLSP